MTSNIINFNFAKAMQLYENGTKKDHLDCKEYINKHIFQVLDTSTHVVFRDNKPIVLDNESFTCFYLDKFEKDIQLWYKKRFDMVTLVSKPNQNVLVGSEVNIFCAEKQVTNTNFNNLLEFINENFKIENSLVTDEVLVPDNPQDQINANQAKILELKKENEILLKTLKETNDIEIATKSTNNKQPSPICKTAKIDVIEGGGMIAIAQLHAATKYKGDSILEGNVFKKKKTSKTEVYTQKLGKEIFNTFDNGYFI